MRCAMFRRAASLLDFSPRDGDHGRGARPAGRVRAARRPATGGREPAPGRAGRLVRAVPAAQGAAGGRRACSTPARKRPLPLLPRGIGIVTSLGAAALHDVVTALAPARAAHPGGAGAGGGAGRAGAGGTGRARCRRSTRWPSRHARRDPAGARRRLDRGPLGLQRRAAGAHHRAKPGAGGQRRGPRNRLHHRRLLRRPARAHADRGGRARRRSRARPGWARWTLARGAAAATRLPRGWTRRASAWTRPRRGWAGPRRAWRAQQLRLAQPAQRLRYAVLSRLERLAQAQRALQAELPRRLARALAAARRAAAASARALRLQLLDPRAGAAARLCLADRCGRARPITSVAQTARRARRVRATLADGEVDLTRARPADANSVRESADSFLESFIHNQPDEKNHGTRPAPAAVPDRRAGARTTRRRRWSTTTASTTTPTW